MNPPGRIKMSKPFASEILPERRTSNITASEAHVIATVGNVTHHTPEARARPMQKTGAANTDHRSSHQTIQDFARFAEVLDHFQAGNDRFGDLRHDDVPQVNPKSG